MTVAVDLGSGAVKIADGVDASVHVANPIDPELAARVGTTVPLVRRDGARVLTQTPHDAYVRAVAIALDGMTAESVAIAVPDWWSRRALELAEQSFAAHASGPFRLVSPALAAISASPRDRGPFPATVAVLDIGAESSSTTILTEVDGVHRVVGRPAVLHGWAGNAIDRLLLHHVLGWLNSDGHRYKPSDADIASAGRSLLTQVREAKERLSTRPAATLTPDLPDANAELRLVRSEFDEVARGTVDAIVAMLKASIATNAPDGAGAVLLTGGSVSIPLVTQVISVEVGVPVILDDDPATLAVRGAATVEMPAPPRRRRWRRRADAARNVFDLNNAPAPDSEPYLGPAPEPEPGPETWIDEPASDDADGRLGSFIEESRREAAAQPEPEPEPVHVVVGTKDAPRSKRAPRWASTREDSEWSGARRTWVDEDGQFQLRVNDRDYHVDMGTELASTSVTLLLIGRHVFVTLSENGELLRELLLNPDHDYRPE